MTILTPAVHRVYNGGMSIALDQQADRLIRQGTNILRQLRKDRLADGGIDPNLTILDGVDVCYEVLGADWDPASPVARELFLIAAANGWPAR